MKFKRCPDCNSCIFALYYREGAGGKEWVKIKDRYCKKCNKVVLR